MSTTVSIPPGDRFDVAVVGIGLIGAAALRHLAAAGSRCIGIGPAEPADLSEHAGRFGSHFDSGRVTRMLDHRAQRTILSQRAIASYQRLSDAAGIQFHHPVGAILTAQSPGHFAAICDVAHTLNVDCSIHHRTDVQLDTRLRLPASVGAIVEPAPAGHIDPRAMLAAQLLIAQQHGAQIDRSEVVSLIRTSRSWQLSATSGRTVLADRVVVSAGAHLDELEGLAMRGVFEVLTETVVMATIDADEHTRLDGIPALVAQVDDGLIDDIYLVPPTQYPDGSIRLKLGASLQRQRRLDDFAERHQWMSGWDHLLELPRLRAVLEHTVPGLRADAWTTKPCLVSNTASGLPVVDHIDDDMVIAAGCNGSAAKCADAIGSLAAHLALDGRWTDQQLDAADFAVTAGVSENRPVGVDR
jgi:sarcosine oxidase